VTEDVVVDNKLIFIEAPCVVVLCEGEKEAILVLLVLSLIAIDERTIDVNVSVAVGIVLVVPSEEEMSTGSDMAVFLVTDVPI
jgi:hypothetical protein